MPDLGPAELIIVLLVVVMIFGGSRLAEIGGSLGKGIKEFKKAVGDDAHDDALTADRVAASESSTVALNTLHCAACSTDNAISARFCAECGAALHASPSSVTA
ncbi:MAG: twin-arginine translocase TatA/TatE family subunit [Dehalococcoidia bacterium]